MHWPSYLLGALLGYLPQIYIAVILAVRNWHWPSSPLRAPHGLLLQMKRRVLGLRDCVGPCIINRLVLGPISKNYIWGAGNAKWHWPSYPQGVGPGSLFSKTMLWVLAVLDCIGPRIRKGLVPGPISHVNILATGSATIHYP